jgi:hypothetical protein
MPADQQTALSDEQVDAFLGRHETGVLSLARESEPYAIPISYGYDASSRLFYLRLVSTPESTKRQFLASSPRVQLVVYDADDDVYRSVVATGRLERIDREELTVDHVEQFGDTRRPLFEIWTRSRDDLDIELYRIDPDELTGRRVEIDRDADA